MTNAQTTRRKLITVVIALAVVDIAALVFLFSPWGQTRSSAERQYEATRLSMRAKIDEVTPMRGMDKKLVEAKEEIAGFYNHRLPSEGSSITAELGKLASDNHVHITQGRYDTDATDVPGLQQVRIDAILDGNYVQVVKFINALERDKMFFIVDSVTLAQEQGGAVRLNLKLETYMKGQPA